MIKEDAKIYNLNWFKIIKGYFTGHCFYAVLNYRIANWFFKKNIKLIPDLVRFKNIKKFSCEISPSAIIGKGLKILHSQGIVIGHSVIIGENCTLYQNVTIGSNRKIINGQEMPIIGNNVTICAGAVIIGPIKIGDNVIIGANSVVNKDIPNNSIVGGIPAKMIKKYDKN